MPAVLRTGSQPMYSLFHGDHRPYYIDLDAEIAFADMAYEIHRPTGRGIQLKDPRITEKYRLELLDQLSYHNIWEKHQQLQHAAETYTWSNTQTDQYEVVDTITTEAMISVENKAK